MKYSIKEYPERYFIGIELEGGVHHSSADKIPLLWESFFDDMKLLDQSKLQDKFIGLECYPPDFRETKTFDYYTMIQTSELVEQDGFVSKKLPAGSYISFEILFRDITNQIHACYEYVKEHNINVHMGFDFEDYLNDQDYTNADDSVLHFSMLLETDNRDE
ncbi:GyrI-like domain-containing protein [Candidatus Xianfuyuplasma coldseepsis]|uniref:GyrI-like domain-containing protein n=1 Tax=Candidatus Xianfuyuplasma coldseepsis TaxID=2782163 RepID=A0A7L7KVH6_9MOLU|nr:GyrI-like domain-containing protein [Xianfuyuplasma coldseepsis]QMS85974.1 GyrI-like domain-containing protein [Xianfuyuplasma coldseepsis]